MTSTPKPASQQPPAVVEPRGSKDDSDGGDLSFDDSLADPNFNEEVPETSSSEDESPPPIKSASKASGARKLQQMSEMYS